MNAGHTFAAVLQAVLLHMAFEQQLIGLAATDRDRAYIAEALRG